MVERDFLLNTLNKAKRVLYILEEQAAGFGSLNIPVHLKLELEDKRVEVTSLQSRIENPKLGQIECPYRGLFAFREKDAPFFFGRETFIEQLYREIKYKPLVAVVGASGSGKSSVVFAGLIPRLKQEAGWIITSFRPGGQPFQSMAAALIPLYETELTETAKMVETNRLAAALKQGDITLTQVLSRIVEKSSKELQVLLVADQFEELYTTTKDDSERQKFLDMLLSTLNLKTTSLKLILTLRADFVNAALLYRPLADALQAAQQNLGPMTLDELERAIKEPAQQLWLKIEDGLTERILTAVDKRPGDLPLLEFALKQLWEQQDNGALTNVAYNQIGGVEESLTQHADEVYLKLSQDEQKRLRRIFTQLVQPGIGTEDTRRQATRAEVEEENWPLVTEMANADARLVVTGRDETKNEDTVEFVHEALIGKWQRLRQWMGEDREFRTWQERLRSALSQWETSQQDEGALLRGVPLSEAEDWFSHHGGQLNTFEQQFIQTSRRVQDKQHAEQAGRERRELERAAREQVWRWLIVVLGTGLIVVLLVTVFAVFQWQDANQQRYFAEEQKQIADTQAKNNRDLALLLQSYSTLSVDPDVSLLLLAELGKRKPLRCYSWTIADLKDKGIVSITCPPKINTNGDPNSSSAIASSLSTTIGFINSPVGRNIAISLTNQSKVLSLLDPASFPPKTGEALQAYLNAFSPSDSKGIETIICPVVNRNLSQGEWKEYFYDEPYRKTCSNLPAGE